MAGTDIDGVVDGIDGATADESAATDPYAYASVDDEWSWPTDTASTRPGAGAADATTWTTAGSSTLADQLLDRIGAPLTLYQRAQLGATQEIAAVSLNGYLGADGAWYDLDNTESLYAATMDKWRRTQYLEFAERVS